MEFEEQYYQESKSTYEADYSDTEKIFFQNKLQQKEIIINKNLSKAQFKQPYALLDIGCGEGYVLDYFYRKGMDVAGIDYSQWAIHHHNPEVEQFFFKGDCTKILPELAKEGKRYDVINMDSALDMMLDPQQVIAYCGDLLQENGILLIKVANNYSPLQTSLLESGQLTKEYWLDDPGHPSYFNKDGFKRFMQAQGYRCVDFYGESFIDLNLLNPLTNYYEKQGVGKQCYEAKLQLENMMHNISPEKALEVFHLMGEMGFGREIIGVFVRE